jgi:GxxExxY protein
MEINKITETIIGSAMEVHTNLGPGLLESIYRDCLFIELIEAGLIVKKEVPISFSYKGHEMNVALRLDLLVDDRVIVEIKSVEFLKDIHEAQILSYLKVSGKEIGLLLNFNVRLLKMGIRRFRM